MSSERRMRGQADRSSVPVVSVIIVTFNTHDLTRACLESVLADGEHLQRPIEIIVVDNGSSDNTAAMVSAQFPAVRLIANTHNLGFSRGNNLGLQASTGRYLFLLNSDTRVQPGTLAALVQFMDARPEAGACGPMLLNEDGTLQPSGRRLPSFWDLALGMTRLYRLWKPDYYLQPGRDYSRVVQVEEVSGAAIMVRREAYERVGGLDERFFAYYEDVDWCRRITAAGYTIHYVPTARVVHRWGGSGQAAAGLSTLAAQQSLRYYFAKHHARADQIGVQFLLAAKEVALLVRAAFRRSRLDLVLHWNLLKSLFTTSPYDQAG